MTEQHASRPWAARALWAVVVLGVAVRVVSYAANRSLWLDESMLANNVCQRDYRGLLRPLDNEQAAPFGFLWAVKAATGLLGPTEYGLRLVPFLSSLAVLPLAYAFVRQLLDRRTALVTTAIVAMLPPEIYYAVEVKQYATDSAVALGLLALAVRYARRPTWLDAAGLAGAGGVAVWFSHPSVFVLAAIGLWFAVTRGPAVVGRGRRTTAAVAVVWAAAVAADYWFQIRAVNRVGAFFSYWKAQFLPAPPRSIDDARKTVKIVVELFQYLFHVDNPGDNLTGARLAMLSMALTLAGASVLWIDRRRAALALLGLPFVVVAVASAAHRFPLGGRLILFLLPLLCTCVAVAVIRLTTAADRGCRGIGWATVAALSLLPAMQAFDTVARRPEREAGRSAFLAVRRDWRAGDTLLVGHWAGPAYDYYRDVRHRLDPIPAAAVVRLPNLPSLADRSAVLARLAGGGRVWVVYAREDGDETAGRLVLDALKATTPVAAAPKFDGMECCRFDPPLGPVPPSPGR